MDFVEKMFGVAPDGGSGALELLIVLALTTTAMAPLWMLKGKRWLRRTQHRERLRSVGRIRRGV